ncbi:MAG: transposase [Sedimenticola sp.]|nr:MAG: transposase [Sedimenticola sp.]
MPLRAYKFRFYPNTAQRETLSQMFGTGRWVWNKALAWRSDCYKALGESVSGVDFSRELTFLKKLDSYAWLKQVPVTIGVQTLRDQDRAFTAFFKGTASYPRFKRRGGAQSIRLQFDQRVVARHYRGGELLKIPGFGPCKIRWSRKPHGIPKMVTVRCDSAGRYWVSMAIDEPIAPRPAPGAIKRTIGVDLGTTHLAVLSTGVKIDNPRHLLRYRVQLHKQQQRLARQQKGSNRREQIRRRIAQTHARITDCRREALHRFTTTLINDNQVIIVENLNVDGMGRSAKGTRETPGRMVKQKAGLNRSIRDAAFAELVRQLEYKADWYGRTLLKVDRFFPSSKTCSHCDHKLDELDLSVREWVCPKCGTQHDRDINAAINIEREGLRQLIHPEDTGGVRAFGGEGACSAAVSARIVQPSNACLEQV